MRINAKHLLFCLSIALFSHQVKSLVHRLVFEDETRRQIPLSHFGFLLGGRLDVIVDNFTITPDVNEGNSEEHKSDYGFVLTKSRSVGLSHMSYGVIDTSSVYTCMFHHSKEFPSYVDTDVIYFSLNPASKKVNVECSGKFGALPPIRQLPTSDALDPIHRYQHKFTKRAALNDSAGQYEKHIRLADEDLGYFERPKHLSNDIKMYKCPGISELPLSIHTNNFDQRSFSFRFTMPVEKPEQEGYFYMAFQNCLGKFEDRENFKEPDSPPRFNLSLQIYESNYPENYLSAEIMPLPQMYFIFSVIFFLLGCIWVNFISRQREGALKIHRLMSLMVFVKACSLLFHGINYHYIAINGQPVVTWAYLYYATRSFKGLLFFITLVLIGTGWSFVRSILNERDKRLIILIVTLQFLAHISEIAYDTASGSSAASELWSNLYNIVDMTCCVLILFPISWSVDHLELAAKTDGKAAINLKKLSLFKKFYIVSTIYIYTTRILTYLFEVTVDYKSAWLTDLQYEIITLAYFIITGYFFQPIPTNPYLLLSDDTDANEDILFMKWDNSHRTMTGKETRGTVFLDREDTLKARHVNEEDII